MESSAVSSSPSRCLLTYIAPSSTSGMRPSDSAENPRSGPKEKWRLCRQTPAPLPDSTLRELGVARRSVAAGGPCAPWKASTVRQSQQTAGLKPLQQNKNRTSHTEDKPATRHKPCVKARVCSKHRAAHSGAQHKRRGITGKTGTKQTRSHKGGVLQQLGPWVGDTETKRACQGPRSQSPAGFKPNPGVHPGLRRALS